jgi:serine/threonine protein kinase
MARSKHAGNFLHRDIAPDNIIVRADGSPALLDFGAALQAVAEMSRAMTGIEPGYSPHEQYSSDSRMTGIVKAGCSPNEQYSSDSRLQGPWSFFCRPIMANSAAQCGATTE